MSLALNPLALAAATLSLGAHVAVFGVLLGSSTEEPTEVVHLVNIVTASALPSPPLEQQAAMPSVASEPARRLVPEQAAPLSAPATTDITPAQPAALQPADLMDTPAPTAHAAPRAKPVAQSTTRESISIVEPLETASLAPEATRQSTTRSVLSIETQTAVAPGNAQPRYPLVARKRGYEGQTVVRARVSESGRVLSADIAESSGYEVLDLAAQNAVSDWRFRPAIRGGRPIAGQIDVPIEFRLR